jgi:hypothetical protein
MTKEELKVMIDETINSNGARNITGKALNLALSAIVDSMGTASNSEDEGLKRNDVNFFDYDGTLLYAYTWEEAKALTELPALPVHDDLEVREWNYTLEDIKAQGTETNIGKADIGACVYDSNGDQVCATGVFIFERGSNVHNIIKNTVAWIVSIPNTVINLNDGFMSRVSCFNELKFPISIESISNYYGAMQGTLLESDIWWNGDDRHFSFTCDWGKIIKIPNNFPYVHAGNSSVIRYIYPENIRNVSCYTYSQCQLFDFTRVTAIPQLNYQIDGYYPYIIVVPDALYDEWINATNWSNSADKIYKHSMLPWLK